MKGLNRHISEGRQVGVLVRLRSVFKHHLYTVLPDRGQLCFRGLVKIRKQFLLGFDSCSLLFGQRYNILIHRVELTEWPGSRLVAFVYSQIIRARLPFRIWPRRLPTSLFTFLCLFKVTNSHVIRWPIEDFISGTGLHRFLEETSRFVSILVVFRFCFDGLNLVRLLHGGHRLMLTEFFLVKYHLIRQTTLHIIVSFVFLLFLQVLPGKSRIARVSLQMSHTWGALTIL